MNNDNFHGEAQPRTAHKARFWIVVAIIAALVLYVLVHRLMPAPHPAMPQGPVPVTAFTVRKAPVQTWNNFSARTRAVNQADIRPEVGGRITEIRFQDGQAVKAGDILLVIDPRSYEAALAKARADLETAQSNASFAKTELGRAQGMIKTQAIARRLFDQRMTDAKTTAAAVASAQAAVTNAGLDVEHAYVRAPIDGRTGRSELTVGNLVQAGPNAPLLTSIVSTGAIYADFEVDEQTYMNVVHAHAEGLAQEQHIPVQLIVTEGGKAYDGFIATFDNHIDSTSGTIRARARFANEDGALVPGMFVSVRLSGPIRAEAITVPEGAINTDQSKKFVYTIGADGKAAYSEVTPGDAVDGKRIVLSGLKDGDRVIVDGMQHVQPGAAVTTDAPMPAASPCL